MNVHGENVCVFAVFLVLCTFYFCFTRHPGQLFAIDSRHTFEEYVPQLQKIVILFWLEVRFTYSITLFYWILGCK